MNCSNYHQAYALVIQVDSPTWNCHARKVQYQFI